MGNVSRSLRFFFCFLAFGRGLGESDCDKNQKHFSHQRGPPCRVQFSSPSRVGLLEGEIHDRQESI
jgi:hypothetical protein